MTPTYEPNFDSEYSYYDFQDLPWTGRVGGKNGEVSLSSNIKNVQHGSFVISSIPFTWSVGALLEKLNRERGYNFNVCVANLYKNQESKVGWHKDAYKGMDYKHDIAIVSYGAEREFWWKCDDQVGPLHNNQKLILQAGSLFIMPGGFQEQHKHCVPLSEKACGPRISLTFRSFLS